MSRVMVGPLEARELQLQATARSMPRPYPRYINTTHSDVTDMHGGSTSGERTATAGYRTIDATPIELGLTASRFRAVSGPTKHSNYVKGNWWVQYCFYWCNRRETSEIQGHKNSSFTCCLLKATVARM